MDDSDLPMVLHVRTVNGFGGGPEKTILNSPRYLPPLGYRSVCAYLHPPNDPGVEVLKERAAKAEAEIIPIPDKGVYDLSLVGKLADICRQRNVQIWHAHDDKTNFLGLLVRRRWHMKLVTTAHGWVADTFKTSVHKFVSRVCLRFYDKIICVSPNLDNLVKSWGIADGKRVLIENAIDAEYFRRRMTCQAAREELGLPIPENALLLAGLGRLEPVKAFDHLISSVAEARVRGTNVYLWIGGEGSLKETLQSQIDSLELQAHVRLLGHVHDPRLMLQAADFFVLSSLSEGLPNVVLEAMALETPIISTRVEGVVRVILDGELGMLVDIANKGQMVDAICRLAASGQKRRELAVNARRRIETNYDFRIRMQKVARVYDSLT